MPLYLKLFQHAFSIGFSAILPSVAVLLAIGLVTSILQAIFQIEDATFALLPKTMAMILLAVTGGFGALGVFVALARNFILTAPALVHQSWY
ncbi:MAG: flagellar biosynthetic protein FliQ [Rhodospirillales bacterium]|nr:flagellar biosynthetic protein FliQ [Rhodospirillales bacterium]MDE2390105.1 flagellar biosynthetic protein FliQ [Rhodospirillales bacterium]